MTPNSLPRDQIIIPDRFRKDYGDVAELAESIRRYGLIHPPCVSATNDTFTLVAGGRRMAAIDLLGWKTVPVTFIEQQSERQRRILEMEENIRRKSMTWQEECLAVAEVHRLQVEEGIDSKDYWTQERTGQMLGLSVASVSYNLAIAKALRDPNSGIHGMQGFTDALRFLMDKKQREIEAEQARRIHAQLEKAPISLEPISTGERIPQDELAAVKPWEAGELVVPLSKICRLGDCCDLIKELPSESVDHCITDPPYAIDMANLQQSSNLMDVSSTAAEHQPEENLLTLGCIIPELFRVIKPNGFCVLWTDVMIWYTLYHYLVNVGFKVQRWPFIWHKTTQCKNEAAQYNFTKNYEIAIIARKAGATLVQQPQTSILSAPNTHDGDHPFYKPLDAWYFLLKHLTLIGQTILDPFAGEGSCPDACVSTNRKFVAFEKNEVHYNKMLIALKEKLDLVLGKPRYE